MTEEGKEANVANRQKNYLNDLIYDAFIFRSSLNSLLY